MIKRTKRLTAAFAAGFAICALIPGTGAATTIATVTQVTITKVVIYPGSAGTQAALFYFTPAVANLAGCSNTTGNAAWIDFTSTTPPTGQDLYATVWSAYLSGQTIGFGISSCIDGGFYPVVNQVSVPSL